MHITHDSKFGAIVFDDGRRFELQGAATQKTGARSRGIDALPKSPTTTPVNSCSCGSNNMGYEVFIHQ